MKRLLQLPILIILMVVIISPAQEKKTVKTTVTAATVFSERAMVTRGGSIQLAPGSWQLILSNLPAGLLDESVRVSGKGPAGSKILDVNVETMYTAEIQEKQLHKLQRQLDSLQLKDQVAADNIAVLESQKDFIQSLKVESARDINKNMTVSKPSVTDWQNLLSFMQSNLTKIYRDLRKEKLGRQRLEAEIKAVKQKMDQTHNQQSRNFKQVKVAVNAPATGTFKIDVSYLINDVSWYPLYDVHVSSNTQRLELSYYGMVRQNTGEDWKNVRLTLSTAQPGITRTLPELQPLYIDAGQYSLRGGRAQALGKEASSPVQISYRWDQSLPRGQGMISGHVSDASTGEPLRGVNILLDGSTLGASSDGNGNFTVKWVPAGKYRLRVNYIGYRDMEVVSVVKEKQSLNMMMTLSPQALEMEAAVVVAREKPQEEQAFAYSVADVQNNQFSSVFDIPAKSDIPGDNSPHKVTIAIEPLDVRLDYITIPKLIEDTFVKGVVVNRSEYMLLPGQVNVFVGNEFVNKSQIQTVVPNDSFELALGVDEGIKVSRKLINRFSESKGFLGGRKNVIYEFEIKVTNAKSSPQMVEVIDQLPISQNEKVKIELLEPDRKDVRMDKQNRIQWKLPLKAAEVRKLTLKYKIEFPADSQVFELE